MIFISHPLGPSTPIYGGKKVEFTPERCMAHGDTSNSLLLKFTNHASTHVDAPRHFIADGKTVTDYSAAQWLFRSVVLVDVPSVVEGELIDGPRWEALDNPAAGKDVELVLLRTGFEKRRGEEA